MSIELSLELACSAYDFGFLRSGDFLSKPFWYPDSMIVNARGINIATPYYRRQMGRQLDRVGVAYIIFRLRYSTAEQC